MKLLVVGGGGREHTIIRYLKKNPDVETIFACPGNGGMVDDAVCTGIGATDIEKIVAFAVENAIDYAVDLDRSNHCNCDRFICRVGHRDDSFHFFLYRSYRKHLTGGTA